jgi:hypothetical protein
MRLRRGTGRCYRTSVRGRDAKGGELNGRPFPIGALRAIRLPCSQRFSEKEEPVVP